jgi:hypothetical protein
LFPLVSRILKKGGPLAKLNHEIISRIIVLIVFLFVKQLKNPRKSFLLITVLFEGTFTSFFKDKKSLRSHKAVKINVFLTIFA